MTCDVWISLACYGISANGVTCPAPVMSASWRLNEKKTKMQRRLENGETARRTQLARPWSFLSSEHLETILSKAKPRRIFCATVLRCVTYLNL